MFQHVIRRLLEAIPVVLITTFLVFFLLRMIPGDPALSLAGQDPTPEQVAAIRRELQLDQPIPVQYVNWLGRVAVGDFGKSYVFKREVSELIGTTFPATLELNIVAMFIAVAIGIPFGAVAALKPNSRWSVALAGFSAFAMGIPPFLMGLIYLLVFALVLGWLPPGGRVSFTENPLDAARSIILPALTMGLPSAMFFARFVFSALNNVLAQDYVRTARGKGLSPRTVTIRHALRNAMLPVVTVMGMQFGRQLGGTVVVEQVFAWPGMGRLALNAIQSRDYILFQTIILLLVLGAIAINLLVDLSYGFLDPRIRQRE